ncbi:MAG: sulfotransferase [Parvularcula sp.]|jgi:hypothetical protein|nr:sulfotransferase [Parvularcula sp.]
MTNPVPTVVILLSDKRSGSTIFQTEFLRHEKVAGLGYSSHTYLESHHWLKAAVMLGRPSRLFADSTLYPNYGSGRNARTYMIDTIQGNLPDFVPPTDDLTLIHRGWEALCAAHANPVFFEKSPQVLAHWAALSLLLEWRAQTPFRVKLVGLVRNPLAVMHSSERLFGSVPNARQFGWVEIYRNLLALRAMLGQNDLMILRHEDIIAEPQGRFADICRFVGLDPDPTMGAGITDHTQNRWLEDLDYGLQLDESVRQVAFALGYSREDLENPKPQATAAYRPSRPSFVQFLRTRRNHLRDRVVRPARMRTRQTRHNRS